MEEFLNKFWATIRRNNMNIIYIPLDERPCNYIYPEYICNVAKEINIIKPSKDILGNKKDKANIDKIWEFIFDNVDKCDIIVLSIEMVVYGGLLPSRVHNLSSYYTENIIEKLKLIKQKNHNIKIYAFNLIMRTPKYNSSDEEPDYYEQYGYKIFKRAYLKDKKNRQMLDEKEKIELKEIYVPKDIIKDYEDRRKFNTNVTMKILELVEYKYIDFLVIPQDDSSLYGYTAIEQKNVYSKILEKRLQNLVYIYPGADEVGASLIARAVGEAKNISTKIYVVYASTYAPYIIPLYEDRPMMESLKSHIDVSKGEIVHSLEEADFVLAINSPGKFMQEASCYKNKDITYASFRNLTYFVNTIKRFLDLGKKIVVADCAFANGGDIELLEMLDEENILNKIVSYKAWNTTSNTMGTSLLQGIITNLFEVDKKAIKDNLIYHILEDGIYQAIVRQEVTDKYLKDLNATYFNLYNNKKVVSNIIKREIILNYNKIIKKSFDILTEEDIKICIPWNRMFEIELIKA